MIERAEITPRNLVLDTVNQNGQSPDDFGVERTDLDNRDRFIIDHRGECRYVEDFAKWAYWTGSHWEISGPGEAMAKAYDTVRQMQRKAVEVSDSADRKLAMKWTMTSQSVQRIEAIIKLVKGAREMMLRPGELDQHSYFLNVENGTIDLTTGELLEHNRSDLITKLAPVQYDPNATCPRWIQFLSEIFQEKTETIEFVQQVLGYSTTADVSEHCIFILYGPGANGKTVFTETIRSVLGDYAQAARPELLLPRRTGGASEEEAVLKGARFVLTSETGSGQELDDARVKRLTGGDTIQARYIFGHLFAFEPTHKIFLATNHKPVIDGTDPAMERRIHLIPFNATFKGESADKHLRDKLRKEAPGILNWLVEGCLAWRQNPEGLRQPDEIQEATSDYLKEMDTIASFIAESCLTGDMFSGKVRAGQIYAAYKSWCERVGEQPEKQRGFAQRLVEKGYIKERDTSGNWYLGLGLRTENTE